MTMPTNPSDGSFRQFAVWLLALFLVVLGAQLWVVQLYGSPLPMWDQWYEADAFFRPWAEGHLTWRQFFEPFNEHRILFTRLLDLGVIELNGRWEPMLQMTINAFIHAAFACGLAGCLWKFLGRKNGWLVCSLLAPFFALPYAAENALWPMNSQLYFMSLGWLVTLAGLGFGKPGGLWWWFGLVAAFMGLFTMASGLFAPVAVGGLVVLRALKARRLDKGNLITFVCCLAVAGLGSALRVTMEADQPLRAHSLMEFSSALARNLTWPFFRAPAMLCLMPLPLAFLLALYFRSNFPEPRAAEFLLVLGLWGGLQSAGLAYGRANYGDIIPASRYMDVLNIFVIASLFALVRFAQSGWPGRFPKWVMRLLPLVFAGIIFFGLCRISQIVVDNLLLPTRMMNLMAEERVETFRATGDVHGFREPPTVRPDPEVVLEVLRDTNLQAILPDACLPVLPTHTIAEGGPPASAPVTGRLTSVSQLLRQNSETILAAGLLLFAGLCGYGLARGALGLTRANSTGIIVLLAGLIALGFVWSKRALQRDSVEYGLQRELAAYFKSANHPARAAFHEHRADALLHQMNSNRSGRP